MPYKLPNHSMFFPMGFLSLIGKIKSGWVVTTTVVTRLSKRNFIYLFIYLFISFKCKFRELLFQLKDVLYYWMNFLVRTEWIFGKVLTYSSQLPYWEVLRCLRQLSPELEQLWRSEWLMSAPRRSPIQVQSINKVN